MVLPVPGLPEKIRWKLISGHFIPRSWRRRRTFTRFTRLSTSFFTASRPMRAFSSSMASSSEGFSSSGAGSGVSGAAGASFFSASGPAATGRGERGSPGRGGAGLAGAPKKSSKSPRVRSRRMT